MATKTIRLADLENHVNALKNMCAEARQSDDDCPDIDFAEIRSRAKAIHALVSPESAGAGDGESAEAIINKHDSINASGAAPMPADAALIKRAAKVARKVASAQAAVASSAAAAIFPTLGQPIERRTIAEDEQASRVEIVAETQRRLERGDSVLDVFPSLKRFGVEG